MSNLCVSCGQDFGSLAAFSKHRVGDHSFTYSEGVCMTPMREDGRRCLTVDEIRDMRDEHGRAVFAQNNRGRWSIADGLAKARALNYAANTGMDDDDEVTE